MPKLKKLKKVKKQVEPVVSQPEVLPEPEPVVEPQWPIKVRGDKRYWVVTDYSNGTTHLEEIK